jgi:uncharacterized membrane protein YuzA (DUF378 family)
MVFKGVSSHQLLSNIIGLRCPVMTRICYGAVLLSPLFSLSLSFSVAEEEFNSP